MKALRIHALESANVVSKAGCEQLVRLLRSYDETHQVVVLSPLKEENLELASLLTLAKERDERLWSVQEQRFKAWNGVIESVLPITLSSEVIARDRKSVV